MNQTLRAHGDHSPAYTLQTAQTIADAMRVLTTAARDYPAEAFPTTIVIRDVVEQLRCGVHGTPELLADLRRRLDTLVLTGAVQPRIAGSLGAERTVLETQLLAHSIIESAVIAAGALEQRLAALRNVIGDLEPGGVQ